MDTFVGETIQIIRSNGMNQDDGFGNSISGTITFDVEDVLIDQRNSSSSNRDLGVDIRTDITIHAPQSTVILDGDIFVVRGEKWYEDGKAFNWIPPFEPMGNFGTFVRKEIKLKRVDGSAR